MKSIFNKRRLAFRRQCLGYLKYVLNDHFSLFLMIGLGFIMMQYRQLLHSLSEDNWPLQFLLILLGFLLAFMGDFNAYLEKADQQFLLPKERKVVTQIQEAKVRGFLVWGSVQVMCLILLLPLCLGLGWPIWLFGLYVLLSLGLKYLIFHYKAKTLQSGQTLLWQKAIRHDLKKKQAVLKFFSLFTQVKGLSQTVKRRAYLDFLLFPFKERTWTYLFARAFLRTSDYLSLSLRLALLSLFSLLFIRQDLVAASLLLLVNYLLLFQLLALYRSFDYQYLTQLFPLPLSEKKHSLKQFLRQVMLVLSLGQTLVALIFFQNKFLALGLLLLQLIFQPIYLNYKIEKWID